MIAPESIARLEAILGRAPLEQWRSHLVPLSAVIDLLEASAAVLRCHGASEEAAELDRIRRRFLDWRADPLLQGTLPADAMQYPGSRTDVPPINKTLPPNPAAPLRSGRRLPGAGRPLF